VLAQMAQAGDFDASLDAKACAALFAAGRTPYLIGGMADAKKAAAAGVTVAVTAVPGHDHSPEATPAGPVAYRGLAMSAFARDRVAAAQFLVTGIANTAAMTLLLEGDPGLPAWSESLARAALDPIVAGFADAAEVSGPAPNVANVGTAWRELSRAQVAILGGASPKAAMGRARTRITAASVLD
jgi:arabinogalactan oligomer/maltooligosaccharide transport system substrate-binding protein